MRKVKKPRTIRLRGEYAAAEIKNNSLTISQLFLANRNFVDLYKTDQIRKLAKWLNKSADYIEQVRRK